MADEGKMALSVSERDALIARLRQMEEELRQMDDWVLSRIARGRKTRYLAMSRALNSAADRVKDAAASASEHLITDSEIWDQEANRAEADTATWRLSQ